MNNNYKIRVTQCQEDKVLWGKTSEDRSLEVCQSTRCGGEHSGGGGPPREADI